jgi:hypothetical protein
LDGPRDERDFKAELEIRTPAWLPGIRIATSFRRLWDKRGADYANRTAEFAGIDTDELEHQLNQGGPIADLFLEGGRRVVEDGDEVLCDAVTRLVAAALRDDALIHDASYLMKKLSICEALHIRAICAIPRFGWPPPIPRFESIEEWYSEILAFSAERIAVTCRASKALVRAALGELISSGFVEKVEGTDVPEVFATSTKYSDLYKLTELGADFRDLILTIDVNGEEP